MRRVAPLLVVLLAVLLALPVGASARAPGMARVEGNGDLDFTAATRAQLFGEVEGGRVQWTGRGTPPRVVTCADARALRTCAVRRKIRGSNTYEWRLFAPARVFILARNYRLFIDDATSLRVGITGTGTLAVQGQGELTVGATGEPQAYDGYTAVDVAPPPRPRRAG
jgi:hypothetical protein